MAPSLDTALCGWLLLQGTLIAAVGVLMAAGLPGLSSDGRARIALATLLLMSVVGVAGSGSLLSWSWGSWLGDPGATAASDPAAPGLPPAPASAGEGASTPAYSSPGAAPADPAQPTEEIPSWATTVAGFFEPAAPPEVAQARGAHRAWWAIAALVITAQVFGLARFLWGGLWAVRYRRRAVPVFDADLLGLRDEVAAQLGLQQTVGIGEVAELSTPAVIGLRRPLVLLPAEWRTWNGRERRAVLAHELAHVRRRDFLTTAIAGGALVPQFYHPLAHLLVARLRLEQELAADALCCGAAGGRERYLQVLAGLALRRADARTEWPASALLPTRRMFVRRIEMLRTLRIGPARGSALGNAVAGLGLVAITLAATGLRPLPAMAQQNAGAAPDAVAPAGDQRTTAVVSVSDPVHLMAVPGIAAIVDLDLQRLRESPQIQSALAQWPPEAVGSIEKGLGAPLEKIKRVTLGLGNLSRKNAYAGHVVEYSDSAAADAAFGERATTQGPGGLAIAQEGERIRARVGEAMIVHAAEEPWLRLFVFAARSGTPAADSLAGRLERFDPSGSDQPRPPLRVAFSMTSMRPEFHRMLRAAEQGPGPILAAFQPLVTETDTVVLGVTAGQMLRLDGRLDCQSPEAADRVAETLGALRVLAGNILRQEFGPVGDADPMARMMMMSLANAGQRLLESLKFTVSDSSVTVQGEVDAPQVVMLVSLALPAIQQARASARRMQSQNNLKQIALAFHNYHDVHGHFPSATVEGPDGVKRSWRVELLPYLEAATLYDQYRKDEPWDSERNLEVLREMPAVFRHPSQPADTTEAAYQAVAGEGTALSGEKPGLRELTDGSSNTILVVESRRTVPWTKPEDLPLDPEAVLAGGFGPDGIAVAFADGAVRILSETLAPEKLRALLTRAGGEVVRGY